MRDDPRFKDFDSLDPAERDLVLALSRVIYEIIRKVVAREIALDNATKSGPPVYLIQGVDGGPVKIGVAADPEKRLAELQRTSPVKLQILGTFAGGFAREKQLHAEFAEWRLHGEWFDADCPGLLDLLEREDVPA